MRASARIDKTCCRNSLTGNVSSLYLAVDNCIYVDVPDT